MALETAAAAASASCSIFYSHGFPIHNHRNPSSSSSSSSRGIIHRKTFQIPYFSSSSSTVTPPLMRRYFSCNKTNSHHHRCIVVTSSGGGAAAASSSESEATEEEEGDGNLSQEFGILLEVEGVLMDVNRVGYRQAFNLAFQKLGLDCANWTEPIYLDLIRKTGGDEEKMLVLFFNRIGWPSSLPTNEKETFMKKVLKEKKNALDEFVMAKSLPLRPGVENFIDDALNGGIPVVVLTAYSKNGEKLARSIAEKLGPERISRIKIVGKEETENSFYGQLVLGKGVSLGLDEQLAKEARKAASAQKQKIAKEVASLLKVSIDLDTSSTESLQKIVATLRAGAEYAEVPVSNCVLVAGSQTGVVGAERIGMPCVVLRSSLTSRAEFPSAKATMDGFGGADLTISKLRQKSLS